MLDGALRPPLKEHKRRKPERRAAVLLQQVQPHRQAKQRKTGQKPRTQKTH
jgi:hypothetical protein